MSTYTRHRWTLEELIALYELPFFELLVRALDVHRQFHKVGEIQVCHLISVKTGGCSEDCRYCAQSSRYKTAIKATPMMTYEEVIEKAKNALALGATRVCLSAAWRGVRDSRQFDRILEMVKGVASMGVEVCCTLGLLNEAQAKKLKRAGLYAYNHNLDSSRQFYQTVVTTRSYEDRIETLDAAKSAGLSVCCGGIVGMGETAQDRLKLILTLSQREPHPDSVPINRLVPIEGTPFGKVKQISHWEMVRTIAVARIVLCRSMIRLAAGRLHMSDEEHMLAFLAGANSIFSGEKLLTVANCPTARDEALFHLLGLKKKRGRKERVSD